MTLTRSRSRRLLAGAAALAAGATLLAGCASSAPADDADSLGTVRFQFNWTPDVEWAPWYVAEDAGYFADAGVDVELQHGGTNTASVAQIVAAGQADIGVASSDLELIEANAQGADLVVLGAMYQRSPFGYTWMTDSGIEGPEDLVGKRIGGVQGDQLQIDAVFAINGLDPDYEFVTMGWDPAPLPNGEVDVITSYTTNQPIQLRQAGYDVTAVTFSDFGLPSYGDVLFASRAYLEEHGDAVTAALAALIKGVEADIADPSKGVDLAVNTYGIDSGLDEAFATEANAAYIELMTSDFTDANGVMSVDPDFFTNEIYPGYEAAGQTDLPDVADFVDTSYLAAAHASLG